MREFTISMKWNEAQQRWLFKEKHFERWNFPDCEFCNALFEDLDRTKTNTYRMVVQKKVVDE